MNKNKLRKSTLMQQQQIKMQVDQAYQQMVGMRTQATIACNNAQVKCNVAMDLRAMCAAAGATRVQLIPGDCKINNGDVFAAAGLSDFQAANDSSTQWASKAEADWVSGNAAWSVENYILACQWYVLAPPNANSAKGCYQSSTINYNNAYGEFQAAAGLFAMLYRQLIH